MGPRRHGSEIRTAWLAVGATLISPAYREVPTGRTGRSQDPHSHTRSDYPVSDEHQPTAASSNPSTPGSEPLSAHPSPAASEPPTTTGVSRRTLLISTCAGVVGGAALGAGAVAFYTSQTSKQNGPTQSGPGGQFPQGNGSRIPRDRSGMPSGARPSGGAFPSGGPGGYPSGMPTDQPT